MMGYVEHLGQAAHLRAWLLVTSIVVLLVVIRKVSSHYSLAARRLRNLPVVRENNDDQLRVSISRAFSNVSSGFELVKPDPHSHTTVVSSGQILQARWIT